MTSDLISSLFSNIWSVVLLVLFFGGSIFIHELGHFLAARRRGLHVERFSIGFGPKIVSWNRGGVEYRISWLPFGGYVALPQLADMRGIEGESPEAAVLPPISYADKMIVAVMGAVFNMLFAFTLACIIWFIGQPTRAEMQTTQVGVVHSELTLSDGSKVAGPASEAGLQPGDFVEAIDGKSIATWMELMQTLYSGSGRADDGSPLAVFTIRRGERTLNLTVNPRLSGTENFRRVGIEPADDLSVAQVGEGTPAAEAGLRAADRIVSIDGEPVFTIGTFRAHLQANADRAIDVGVVREGGNVVLPIKPRVERDERTGRDVARAGFIFSSGYLLIYPTPIQQLKENIVMTWRVLTGLLHPRSDIGLSQMSGPPGIARAYLAFSENIRMILWFTILINVNLAIFNLMPIPVLDGGHMLFATIGKLRGRALPQGLIQGSQSVFVVLLFSLMIYVSFFDIRRWVRDATSDPATIEQTSPSNP
ncbi:MAG TPA: RIP metalloprotease RseP [Opitutaceae bacterium]|nr:RIP metalloprotease RseP [Opitutaceae bacterium]